MMHIYIYKKLDVNDNKIFRTVLECSFKFETEQIESIQIPNYPQKFFTCVKFQDLFDKIKSKKYLFWKGEFREIDDHFLFPENGLLQITLKENKTACFMDLDLITLKFEMDHFELLFENWKVNML